MPYACRCRRTAGMQAFGVQVWRFLTTATMFVILLAGSHASPAVAKAASPHHYQTFRGKVLAPSYRYFPAKAAASMPMAAVGAATITAIPTIGP